MNSVEFRELVKVATNKLKDETVRKMLQSDTVYQKDSDREAESELKFMQVDLTKEQKAVCDEILRYKD